MRLAAPVFCVLLIGLMGAAVSAQSVPKPSDGIVFLTRHAERADGAATMSADPSLSADGRARAAALARHLRDAGISAIYVTEYKRTQETAAPLAAALGVTPTVVPAREVAQLAASLTRQGGVALVIGHSNTVPDVVRALGVESPLVIGDNEYDNLLVVTLGAPVRLVRLRY